METPPKISEVPARIIAAGTVAGVAPNDRGVPPPVLSVSPAVAAPADSRPIHALSATILVAVDSLWAVFDWAPPIWIVAMPLCFVAVFVPTFLIQKHLKRDSLARALTFASLLAVLAAIPTPITGTPVGLGLLAWTGLGGILSRFRR